MVVSVNVKVQSVRALSLDDVADTSRACPRPTSSWRRSASARTAMARASPSLSAAPGRPSGTLCCNRRRSPDADTIAPHSSARSATSPWNVAVRTDHPGAGRYCRSVPGAWLRRQFRRRTRACRLPSSGTGITRHFGPSSTPRSARACRVTASACARVAFNICGVVATIIAIAAINPSPPSTSHAVFARGSSHLRCRTAGSSIGSALGGVQAAFRSASDSWVHRPACTRLNRTTQSGTRKGGDEEFLDPDSGEHRLEESGLRTGPRRTRAG